MTDEREEKLLDLARSIAKSALQKGADVAEASARGSFELSVRVRLGKLDLVEEAGHHSVALRMMRNDRVAVTSTSDLTPPGLARCVEDALELVELSESDPCAGPAAAEDLAKPPFADLDLFDPSIADIDSGKALELATAGEKAALDFDARLELSEG